MKVLIVSFRFAPFNSIGANRINALVDFFKRNNIEYKVITSYVGNHQNDAFVQDENVYYVSWFDYRTLKRINANDLVDVKFINKSKNANKTLKHSIFQIVKKGLNLFLYPDPYISWADNAKNLGLEILEDFTPDIIYSSSYPYSSHVVASYLSKRKEIRWYAELRDPWVDNHVNSNKSFFIDRVDKTYSKNILKNASKIITVSNVWKNSFEKLYKVKALVIRNGYIKNELFDSTGVNKNPIKKDGKRIILYTGSIFPDNQNIKAFLSCFKTSLAPNHYIFVYVGGQVNYLNDLLNNLEISEDDYLVINKVSYNESLLLQEQADFLLLFNWMDDKNENAKGVIPGKFYEYIGANKPILLWNEGQKNELEGLCNIINDKTENDKVIILDDTDNVFLKLDNCIC